MFIAAIKKVQPKKKDKKPEVIEVEQKVGSWKIKTQNSINFFHFFHCNFCR